MVDDQFFSILFAGVLIFSILALGPFIGYDMLKLMITVLKVRPRNDDYERYLALNESVPFKQHKKRWRLQYLLSSLLFAVTLTLLYLISRSLELSALIAFVVAIITFILTAVQEGIARKSIEEAVQVTLAAGQTIEPNSSEQRNRRISIKDIARLPWWSWLLIAVSAIMPKVFGVSRHSIIMTLFSMGCAVLFPPQSTLSEPKKALVCFGYTAFIWGLMYYISIA